MTWLKKGKTSNQIEVTSQAGKSIILKIKFNLCIKGLLAIIKDQILNIKNYNSKILKHSEFKIDIYFRKHQKQTLCDQLKYKWWPIDSWHLYIESCQMYRVSKAQANARSKLNNTLTYHHNIFRNCFMNMWTGKNKA